jgi:hypothetical protein
VIDAGVASGVPWADYAIKLVLAGEVFSEQWRDLVALRAGIADPVSDVAALYGTADAGVLGNETPLSVAVRRFLAGRVFVECAPGRSDAVDPAELARSIRDHLVRLNSEFANYVPAGRQLPDVVLRPFQDPDYFPAGVKHRYTRG